MHSFVDNMIQQAQLVALFRSAFCIVVFLFQLKLLSSVVKMRIEIVLLLLFVSPKKQQTEYTNYLNAEKYIRLLPLTNEFLMISSPSSGNPVKTLDRALQQNTVKCAV